VIQSEQRPTRSRSETRRLWGERLQRFADSGTTVVAFCQSEGISSHAFYYWKNKLHPHAPAPDADQPRLLPVHLFDSAPVELVLPNGCALRLAPGCDLAFVRRLVEALGGRPC
jgi:transposase